MTKSKVFKLIIAILLMIFLITTFCQPTFAAKIDVDRIFNKGDQSETNSNIKNIFGAIINVTQIIGVGIAILMLIVLAIKWMSASPSGKAELAKSGRIYILGAIFIFSAVGILQIIKNFSKGIVEDVEKAGN